MGEVFSFIVNEMSEPLREGFFSSCALIACSVPFGLFLGFCVAVGWVYQGAMKHVRPEKYTDNDFSYVKEAWRRRASRDPGGATPALRKQHAVGHDGRLISSGPTRKMGEAYRAFGIKCSNTFRLPVMGSGSAGDSG